MIIKKTRQLRSKIRPSSYLGLALGALMIISLAGMTGLAVLMDVLAERGWAVPSGLQVADAQRAAWQKNTGNEFSGEATAWLFGASAAPVTVDLITKTVIRSAPLGETIKGALLRINNLQKKYLMPLHTWLSIPALGLGILHLTLSSCAANPLPELGLILSGILVATGLFFKWKLLPGTLRKRLYQFHASLIFSGVLLAILFTGHAVMSSD